MLKVIAISGKAGSGKDTVANIIQKRLAEQWISCKIIHYADLLKFICEKYFDWDGQKDEKGRRLLQHVGTDVVRSWDANFWVDFVATMLRLFGNRWGYVIIPDARFPNEIDRLRESGFDVTHLRVERPEYESDLTDTQKAHPSETSLNNYKPDFTIVNDGTPEELKEAVQIWMEEHTYGE